MLNEKCSPFAIANGKYFILILFNLSEAAKTVDLILEMISFLTFLILYSSGFISNILLTFSQAYFSMSTSLKIWSSSGSYPRILTASFCILFQGDCVHSFAFNYYLNVDISYIIPSDHTFLLSSRALYLLDIYIWLPYRHFKFNQFKSEHIIIRSPPSQLSSIPCFLSL